MKKKAEPLQVEMPFGTAWILGQDAIMKRSKLAFICSQKCPGDIILKTYDFARLVRESDRTIVSGFHSPIEKDCLPILLRGPNPVIIVQGRRLSTTRLPAEWQKPFRLAACCSFPRLL